MLLVVAVYSASSSGGGAKIYNLWLQYYLISTNGTCDWGWLPKIIEGKTTVWLGGGGVIVCLVAPLSAGGGCLVSSVPVPGWWWCGHTVTGQGHMDWRLLVEPGPAQPASPLPHQRPGPPPHTLNSHIDSHNINSAIMIPIKL